MEHKQDLSSAASQEHWCSLLEPAVTCWCWHHPLAFVLHCLSPKPFHCNQQLKKSGQHLAVRSYFQTSQRVSIQQQVTQPMKRSLKESTQTVMINRKELGFRVQISDLISRYDIFVLFSQKFLFRDVEAKWFLVSNSLTAFLVDNSQGYNTNYLMLMSDLKKCSSRYH